MTAGFIADRAGKVAEAADYDRQRAAKRSWCVPGRQRSRCGALPPASRYRAAESGVAAGRRRESELCTWLVQPGRSRIERRPGPSCPAAQGSLAKAYALDPRSRTGVTRSTIDANRCTGRRSTCPSLCRLTGASPIPSGRYPLPPPGCSRRLSSVGLARSSGRGGTVSARSGWNR